VRVLFDGQVPNVPGVAARCAATGVTDVIDVSVALCARDRGHAVVTSDPGDIRAADPSLTVLSPA